MSISHNYRREIKRGSVGPSVKIYQSSLLELDLTILIEKCQR